MSAYVPVSIQKDGNNYIKTAVAGNVTGSADAAVIITATYSVDNLGGHDKDGNDQGDGKADKDQQFATVTFIANGTTYKTETVVKSQTAVKPADPTSADPTLCFDNWYADESTTAYDFSSPVTGDITLNATWTSNVKTITYKDGDHYKLDGKDANVEKVMPNTTDPATVAPTVTPENGYHQDTGKPWTNVGNTYTPNVVANDPIRPYDKDDPTNHNPSQGDQDGWLIPGDNGIDENGALGSDDIIVIPGKDSSGNDNSKIDADKNLDLPNGGSETKGGTTTPIPASVIDETGKPVYYYVTVTEKDAAGTVLGAVTKKVLANTENYTFTKETAPTVSGYTFSSSETIAKIDGTDLEIVVTYTKDGGTTGGGTTPGGNGGGGGGGATIEEPSTPLSGTPVLNKTDHFAYINGYADGTVRPTGNVTRAEVATIFYRLLTDDSRKEIFKQSGDLTDVDATAWYNNAVCTLTNAGVITGYSDKTFKPDAPITRAEFATIATRFYDKATKTYDSDPYTDVATSWARQYIDHAAELGIIHGYDDGSFKPENNISRAETATLVNNVLGRTPDKDHLLSGMKTWPDNADTTAWFYTAIQEATNSHDFTKGEQDTYETWTKITAAKDWTALEKEWSKG